ncbi:hypothetical protein ACJ41O_009507 [Fusarium nematophilum]
MANRPGTPEFSPPKGPRRGNGNSYFGKSRPGNSKGVGKPGQGNQNGPIRDRQFAGHISGNQSRRSSWVNDRFRRFRSVPDLRAWMSKGSDSSPVSSSESASSPRRSSDSSRDKVSQATKAPANPADPKDSGRRGEDRPRHALYGTESHSYSFEDAHRALSRGEPVEALMRPTDRKRPPHELTVGIIISAPFHNQCREQIVSADDASISLTGFGAVYSKYRKMVIIQEWAEHLTCLPIYSYQARGLETRRGLVAEYVDIRDVEDRDPAPKQTETETVPARRGEEWDTGKTFIGGRSVVKLTEAVVFNRQCKCSVEGRIANRKGIKDLVTLHVQHVQNKALEVYNERSGTEGIPDMIDEFGRTIR